MEYNVVIENSVPTVSFQQQITEEDFGICPSHGKFRTRIEHGGRVIGVNGLVMCVDCLDEWTSQEATTQDVGGDGFFFLVMYVFILSAIGVGGFVVWHTAVTLMSYGAAGINSAGF
jgi:hypothetical protein